MTPCTILIVEDEKVVAKGVQETLNRLGYDVKGIVSSGEEAIRKAVEIRPDVILMDIVLSGVLDGLQAAEQIARNQDVSIVYMTALSDSRILQRVKQASPSGYVHKPVQDRELHTAIETALSRQILERKIRESQQWLAATLRCVSEAVIATDPQGKVRFMSAMAEALTDTKRDGAVGLPLTDVLPLVDPATGGPLENFVGRYLREDSGFAYHRFELKREGKQTTVGCSLSPIKDDRRRLLGFILVFREAGEPKGPKKVEKSEAEPSA